MYASSAAVYGASSAFDASRENERPLNLYGLSKLAFDNHVRSVAAKFGSTVAGLRYFNVYGPRESHKGKMASMVYQLYRQLKSERARATVRGHRRIRRWRTAARFCVCERHRSREPGAGRGPVRKGVFNVGTGQARTFNDVAKILIARLGAGAIDYVPFPESLAGKYQSFTQADLSSLRNVGIHRIIFDAGKWNRAVGRCVGSMSTGQYQRLTNRRIVKMGNLRDHRIETVAQLQALLGEPNPMTPKKLLSALDESAIDFIRRSPFLVLATADARATRTLRRKAMVRASLRSKTSTRF